MTTEVPPEITEASRLIENWMKEQGVKRWELLGICSRNFADVSRRLEFFARHKSVCSFPSRACDCGLKELLDLLK